MKQTTGRGRDNLPVACSLSGPELAGRRRKLADDVLINTLRVEELEDGYEFGFPGSAGWLEKLVEVINAERMCCPFLTFTLHLEPGEGHISLRVTGPEGTKEFIEAELMSPLSG